MRKRILGSLAVVAAGAGLSFGQGPPPGPLPGPGTGAITSAPGGPPGQGVPGQDSGLMLRNGQAIIPPPIVGGSLSPAEFGPPGLTPDQRDPDGGVMGNMFRGGPFGGGGPGGGGGPFGGGRGGDGLGLWEQKGPPTVWVGFDYLMWWQKSQPMNAALVTSGNATSGGVLGSTSTSVLLGAEPISSGRFSGMRQWLGFWTDEEKRDGFEFSWILMEQRGYGQNFQSSGQGIPLYAVPFRDAPTSNNAAYVVSSPFAQVGGVQFDTQSQAYSIEGNCVLNLYRGDESTGNGIDFLIGMRFFSLEESLNLNTNTTNIAGTTLAFTGLPFGGATNVEIRTTDRIRTFNEFYGLNLGIRGDHNYGRIYWGWSAKIAGGYLNAYSDVTGASSLTNLGVTSVAAGGRFIEPGDIGRHRDGQFAFLPEGGFNLGYQITSKIRFHMGYNFLYMSRVIRPGSLLDQRVNGPMLPTDPRFGTAPAAAVLHDLTRNTDYFMQGINFGLQIGF